MGVNAKLLRRCPPFSELPKVDANELAEMASMHWVNRGDHLYRQGDSTQAFYVVFDGAIKLGRVTPSGKAMVVDFRGPGQIAGGRAVVGQVKHVDDATAIEDTLVGNIPVAPAVRLLSSRPAAIMAMARYLARRLESRESKVAALCTKRVHQRLAEGLLELGRTLGAQADGHLVINARITQAEIADWIGTTRETTSTLLNGLRRAGYIDIVGRHVHLIHLDALESYAEMEEVPDALSVLLDPRHAAPALVGSA